MFSCFCIKSGINFFKKGATQRRLLVRTLYQSALRKMLDLIYVALEVWNRAYVILFRKAAVTH